MRENSAIRLPVRDKEIKSSLSVSTVKFGRLFLLLWLFNCLVIDGDEWLAVDARL